LYFLPHHPRKAVRMRARDALGENKNFGTAKEIVTFGTVAAVYPSLK